MEKLPPKLQQKESAKDTRPIPLSKQTNGASEQISDVIKQGKLNILPAILKKEYFQRIKDKN